MIKIRYILFLFLFVSCIPFFGQNFHGGAMAGIAGTQVAGDTYSGYDKAGLFLGGYVSWDLTKRSALAMELEFFQKGSRKNPDAENNDYDTYLLRVNYFELPVLYRYKINWFTIEAGPSLGFLVGSYENINGQVISDQYDYNKPVALTYQINFGFRFNFTPKMGVILRANDSIFNIRTNVVTGYVWRFWGYGQFNDSLILSFFYEFK